MFKCPVPFVLVCLSNPGFASNLGVRSGMLVVTKRGLALPWVTSALERMRCGRFQLLAW